MEFNVCFQKWKRNVTKAKIAYKNTFVFERLCTALCNPYECRHVRKQYFAPKIIQQFSKEQARRLLNRLSQM